LCFAIPVPPFFVPYNVFCPLSPLIYLSVPDTSIPKPLSYSLIPPICPSVFVVSAPSGFPFRSFFPLMVHSSLPRAQTPFTQPFPPRFYDLPALKPLPPYICDLFPLDPSQPPFPILTCFWCPTIFSLKASPVILVFFYVSLQISLVP